LDGFAAVTGHTLVVGASKDNPVTGAKADVIQAAYLASEAALRLLVPANKNEQVTSTIQHVAEAFGVTPVQGMLSHQLEQNVIDGKKSIILNPSDQQKSHEVATFEQGEVWVVDVLLSTGSGKPKESTHRTTVYKKTNTTYMLKMKTSRAVFSEISTKFGKYPFSLRLLEDEKKARMGIQECANHYLVSPYQVFAEKEGDFVAQFTFTAMLTSNGIVRLTNSFYDEEVVVSEKKLEDAALNELLAVEVDKKKKKKQQKKKE
jgi:curved DNA binding protein